MSLSRCSGNSTTFALYMVRALLMSLMWEEMTKFTRKKLHSLLRDNRSVDYRTCKCQVRSWTSSSSLGGSVLGFPSTAVPAFEREKMI